jgi:hypothetical protein
VRRRDDGALARAIIYGSTLASFAVEDFSVDRLLRLTKDDISSRFSEFKKLTPLRCGLISYQFSVLAPGSRCEFGQVELRT